jgi:hypothetical protein
MASPTYDLFVRAMIEDKQVACVLQGRPRVLSLIILGHTDGEERALAWQTAGESTGRLPGWRNITVSEVTGGRLLDSRLQSGTRKRGEQRWIADVDLDVNPDSPYHPRRQLDALRPRRTRR